MTTVHRLSLKGNRRCTVFYQEQPTGLTGNIQIAFPEELEGVFVEIGSIKD